MNKSQIIEAILDKLREEFELRSRISKSTRDGGNDAESRAASKYDTLAIEENYLADGLAKQAFAAAEAVAEIEKMPLRTFGEEDAVDVGALVELEFSDAKEWFLLAPCAGGTEVSYERTTVTVITPESPLGSKLLVRHIGDRITAPTAKIVKVM